jgi:hypothetical protein
MSDPKPVASTGNGSSGVATNAPQEPPKDANPPKPDEGGVQPRFEFYAGGAYPIPDAFQFRAEAGYLWKPWLYTGLGYMGNFTGKNSAQVDLGFRYNPNEVLSIQPTLFGGVGGFSDYSTNVGSLKENVLLLASMACRHRGEISHQAPHEFRDFLPPRLHGRISRGAWPPMNLISETTRPPLRPHHQLRHYLRHQTKKHARQRGLCSSAPQGTLRGTTTGEKRTFRRRIAKTNR